MGGKLLIMLEKSKAFVVGSLFTCAILRQYESTGGAKMLPLFGWIVLGLLALVGAIAFILWFSEIFRAPLVTSRVWRFLLCVVGALFGVLTGAVVFLVGMGLLILVGAYQYVPVIQAEEPKTVVNVPCEPNGNKPAKEGFKAEWDYSICTYVLVPEATPVPPTPLPSVTPQPAPTNVPTEIPPMTVVEKPAPASTAPVWSSPDNFDAKETEVPLGDPETVTYFQAWNGVDVSTVIHVVVAPGLVVRVRGYQGTRFQVSAMDMARFEQMRSEVQDRDNLPFKPPLVVVTSLNASGLPATWSIEQFPNP